MSDRQRRQTALILFSSVPRTIFAIPVAFFFCKKWRHIRPNHTKTSEIYPPSSIHLDSLMNTPSTPPASIDSHPLQEFPFFRLRQQQNLPIAIGAGVTAAVLGGIAWAAVTVLTEYQLGLMAIGVGLAVGFAVRLGKGIDKLFGIIGATFSLFGCLLGNLLSVIGFVSKQENLSILEVASKIDYAKLPELLMTTFSPVDVLFYGIAVYEGYRCSFRKISQEEIEVLQ